MRPGSACHRAGARCIDDAAGVVRVGGTWREVASGGLKDSVRLKWKNMDHACVSHGLFIIFFSAGVLDKVCFISPGALLVTGPMADTTTHTACGSGLAVGQGRLTRPPGLALTIAFSALGPVLAALTPGG